MILNSKKGLTLLEIIAAALIMAIGIVPIMRFAPTILGAKATVEEITISIFLATQKVEEVRGKILAEFDKQGGYSQSDAFPAPFDNYMYAVTDDLNPSIKTIEVDVWHVDEPDSKFILYTKIAER